MKFPSAQWRGSRLSLDEEAVQKGTGDKFCPFTFLCLVFYCSNVIQK